MRNGHRNLSEQCLRVLGNIAVMMRAGATVKIEIDLHEGGIRNYTESRRLSASDMVATDNLDSTIRSDLASALK